MNGLLKGRSIGLLGTAARVLAGIALVAYGLSDELTGWDAIGGVLVLPVVAVVLGGVLGPAVAWISRATGRLRTPAARTWAVHLTALVSILAIAIALTFVTPIDAPAIWLFFGASLLVAAARGDAGCEALAIPNAISGRRERTGCIAFAPVDALEAAARPTRGG